MASLQRFCHRALLLERGHTVHIGEPHEVADRYLELNFGRDPAAVSVIAVWIEDADGNRLTAAPQHSRVTVKTRVLFMADLVDPAVSLHVFNEEHQPVFFATTQIDNAQSGRFAAGDEVTFSFTFDNVLAPGRYGPVIQLAHRGSGVDVIDKFEGRFSFLVTGSLALGGLIDLPVASHIDRGPADTEHSPV